MTRLNLLALPLITAAALLASTAVHAETWTTHPGATCTSDGPMQRPTNGSLLNIMPHSTGYSTFSCPVPRNFLPGGASPTTYVYINFKATDGPADFNCVLRSVDYYGVVADTDSLTVPKAWNTNTIKYWGAPLEVSGPLNNPGYVTILRCQVPNYISAPGGIISYLVRH